MNIAAALDRMAKALPDAPAVSNRLELVYSFAELASAVPTAVSTGVE